MWENSDSSKGSPLAAWSGPKGVYRAIGDDAAAFYSAPGQLNLVTTDLLVERVHFLRDVASGYDLGYKALAVNLSDIAAMGE